MAGRKKSVWIKVFKLTIRIILYAFLASLVYLLLCRWIMPPVTFTQTGSLIDGYGLKRDYVSWNKISSNVKLAAIASEDQLFPVHNGFDWKSVNKSLNKTNSGRIAGAAASTISQQTAKNVFLFQGSGIFRYLRKALEAVYTPLIEWVWGKQRILEVYLNVIEMGKGIYGIEAASQVYFGKHASELSRTEAAQVIACLPNPKVYTVKPQSRFVKWKSAWILRQMRNLQTDAAVKNLVTK